MDSSEGPKVEAVIRPAASVLWEEPPAHFGGAYSKMLVRPEPCGSKILDYRVSVYQPKAYVAPHKHRIQEQIYYVLEGEGVLKAGGEKHLMRPHDYIWIPPGVPHDFSNTGTDGLVFLVITTPAHDGEAH